MTTTTRPPTAAPRLRVGALTIVTALVVAACGSDDPDAQSQPDDAATSDAPSDDANSETETDDDAMGDDAMGDMAMADMNMGSADLTPAADVDGAALASGELGLLDTRPQGYDDVAGTATLARHADGTTVTVEVAGLMPGVEYVSHVHEQGCDDENGGGHFQFVDGDIEVPPNEIHLAFAADENGSATWTAENAAVAGDAAAAFVIHPREFIDNKIACADLVADDPDAVAAAIAAGPAFDPAVLDHSSDAMDMSDDEMDDGDSAGHEMDDDEMDDDEMDDDETDDMEDSDEMEDGDS